MLLRNRFAWAMMASALVLAPAASGLAQARKAPVAAAALSPAASPEALGFDSARLAKLDAYMQGVVVSGRVAGMTTLLARHGKVVSFKIYGKKSLAAGEPMTEDTIFRIYSMTKPVTGVAMMVLFEEGKWRLDDPVTRYIPEFKTLKVVKTVNPDGTMVLEDMKRPPTMREIMSHTAGFGYGLQDEHPVDKLYREKGVLRSNGLQEMIDRTATIPLVFQPGTSWRYSSSVDIQGYIVEKLSGQTLGQFMEQRIFKPLKMNDTAFLVPAAKASRLAEVYAANKETGKIEPARNIFGNQMPTYLTPPNNESGGAAGTWFWVDPTNDVIFVGMIQRMGGTGGDDLGGMARTLTYQALVHPEK